MINLSGKTPNVLVLGDLMMDHYLWGDCKRISPEAPVQIIGIKRENTTLGGAGNVVNNLKALGAKVDIISVIGNCTTASKLKMMLSNIDVDTQYLVEQKGRTTTKKSRIIAANQQVIRYDQETSDTISPDAENTVITTFKSIVSSYDIILFSDYGKGLFTTTLSQSLIKIANTHNKKILVDPKGSDYTKYKNAYLLTPNKKEASEATRIHIRDNKSLEKTAIWLKEKCNLAVSLITLSEQGVAVYDHQLRIHPTTRKEVFDVTGAGDTILASLGFTLALGENIDNAIHFANLAAGVVVAKIGSATATLDEITQHQLSSSQISTAQRIKTKDEMAFLSKQLKSQGKKIVFTNGCFDLLHIGHVSYLEKAKNFGDVLIVGLNSDQSTALLKGKGRPINSQSDRAFVLAALQAVDYVTIFEEQTPYQLIQAIAPDILVKGGDYQNKPIVGQDIVKELKLVSFIDGKSTTKVIEKIQEG